MTDYGLDISTFPDLDLTFTPISGTRVVGEAVARRWYVELTPYANKNFSSAMVAQIKTRLEQAAAADERVDVCDVDLTWDGTRRLVARGMITTVQGESFSLVYDVSSLTLEGFGAA